MTLSNAGPGAQGDEKRQRRQRPQAEAKRPGEKHRQRDQHQLGFVKPAVSGSVDRHPGMRVEPHTCVAPGVNDEQRLQRNRREKSRCEQIGGHQARAMRALARALPEVQRHGAAPPGGRDESQQAEVGGDDHGGFGVRRRPEPIRLIECLVALPVCEKRTNGEDQP